MPGTDFLQLDPDDAPSGHRTGWLTDRLRDAIADGTLLPGARLPSSRVLAGDLHVARGTVVEAYRRLAEEGLLDTNRGGGTVVAAAPSATAPGAAPTRATTTGSAPNAATPNGTTATDPPGGTALLDISSGIPDLGSFPRAAWVRAERRVLSTATSEELGYADPQGVPALRTALSQWLARSRGVVVGPERVIVTAGVTGALSLLAQVLRTRGITTCALEDPGAHGNREILDYWMDAITPVPVDEQGLDVAALARTGTRAVLATPAHQYPTGVVLSPGRRRELVAWAADVDGLVIEDDYDAEYRYDRAPVRALHAMSPERVAHVSSLSKVLAPALRIGWMVAPATLHDELVRRRWASDLGSPALPQLALAELIASGVLERQLRTLRARHRARRDAAVEAIGRHLPGCTIAGIAAGLHLVVGLPDGVDDTDLAARAREEGIVVHPLAQHRFAPGTPGLVIAYGPHPPARLGQAIRTIGRLAGLPPS